MLVMATDRKYAQINIENRSSLTCKHNRDDKDL